MRHNGFMRRVIPGLIALSGALWAQFGAPPTTYSVVQTNALSGHPIEMKIYRNGSKAILDQSAAAGVLGPKAIHERTLFDLQTHQRVTWDASSGADRCEAATFPDDWGDPFVGSAEVVASLVKQNAKQTGMETLNGAVAKVLEVVVAGNKARMWVDARSGLLLKYAVTAPGGSTKILVEVHEVSLAPPPAGIFTVAASCAAAKATPHVQIK